MENALLGPSRLLESTYNEALLQNEISSTRWTNFKEELGDVSSRLLSLRDKLKHNIMVPIGKYALMKGKLVHTNEILVSLGDGWFVKESSAQAVEICKRRIKNCDEMLEKLAKEKDLLNSRKTFRTENDLFSNNEIIEPYDEESEAAWKEKHRAKVKAYKQEEAKNRQENRLKDEKDMYDLLDSLEMQEELEDELNRLELSNNPDGYPEEMSGDEDDLDDVEEEEEEEDDYEEEVDKNNSNNKFENTTTKEIIQNDSIVKTESKSSNKIVQRVSFAEQIDDSCEEEFEPVYINFKHSETEPVIENSEPDNSQHINSPKDIYKSMVNSFKVPKSILKKSVSVPSSIDESNDFFTIKEENDLESVRRKRSEPNLQVTIGDITERTEVPTTQQTSARPASKFKAARQGLRK